MLLGFALIISLIFLVSYFREPELEMVTSDRKKEKEKRAPRFDYTKIGEGSLALKSEIQSFPFPDLSGEILFLGKNTRPDATLYDLKLHMGLKGYAKTLRVALGQKIYLSYIKQQLHFAKDSTPLWIKPYLNEKGEAWLELGVRLVSDSGEVLLDEAQTFEIESTLKRNPKGAAPKAGIKFLALAEGLEAMKQAKWWAPDRLFELYGGGEYRKLAERQRLEFAREEGPYFLYVREGDTFIWKEQKWQPSEATVDFPLARLVVVSPYRLEWELWDETGLEWVKMAHSKEKVAGITLRAETVFTRMRQRTTSRISCRVDNKALILKKGDWLIHTPSGWHILKNLKEIEAVLEFKMRGELFVFDGLKKVEGKCIFCGTLFDQFRTQMKSVRLPLAHSKVGEHSPPKKKPISTKLRPAVSTDESIKKQKLIRPVKKSRKKLNREE